MEIRSINSKRPKTELLKIVLLGRKGYLEEGREPAMNGIQNHPGSEWYTERLYGIVAKACQDSQNKYQNQSLLKRSSLSLWALTAELVVGWRRKYELLIKNLNFSIFHESTDKTMLSKLGSRRGKFLDAKKIAQWVENGKMTHHLSLIEWFNNWITRQPRKRYSIICGLRKCERKVEGFK